MRRCSTNACRRCRALEEGKRPGGVAAPAWRPFQLAYLLMNLRGIAEPTHPERDVVDLLFFPTGGGKTEAYLGLSAFTLVLRRLRHVRDSSRDPPLPLEQCPWCGTPFGKQSFRLHPNPIEPTDPFARDASAARPCAPR